MTNGPRKKASAGTSRLSDRLVSTTEPANATSTVGYSAAGSAWATLPPIVPRLLIWKWPITQACEVLVAARDE